jgi:hypothetical protein
LLYFIFESIWCLKTWISFNSYTLEYCSIYSFLIRVHKLYKIRGFIVFPSIHITYFDQMHPLYYLFLFFLLLSPLLFSFYLPISLPFMFMTFLCFFKECILTAQEIMFSGFPLNTRHYNVCTMKNY